MSSAEKTEKPTPQRLRKEGRKGKSFNSKDLLAAAVLLVGLLMLTCVTGLERVMSLYIQITRNTADLSPAAAAALGLKALSWTVAPVLVASILGIAVVSLAQSRGIIANEAIRFDPSRLNPVNGFRNLFSLKVVKDLLRSLLYLLAASVFGWLAWGIWGPDLFAQVHAGDAQLATIWSRVAGGVVLGLLLALAPVFLLAGWLDHVLFIRELKTDKHEAKREREDNEIPPEVKQRRYQIAEELSAQVQADTMGSTVMLANPTHIAVGIFLPDDDIPMPFVSVREKGQRARKAIALAERSGVPVVRDVRLARAVYAKSTRYRFVHDDDIDGVMAVVRWLRDVERAALHETAAESASSEHYPFPHQENPPGDTP